MNAFSYLFSLVCSQDAGRSFVIDGQALPFCQRCTGVYIGMGLSFAFLLLTRYHKKGLPPRGIVYINIVSLLVMPVFGYHVLDPGALWRMWSGLIFGNAIAFLLLPAASTILAGGEVSGTYSRGATWWFIIFLILLNVIPVLVPVYSSAFYGACLVLSVVGVLSVICCVLVVAGLVTMKAARFLITKGLSHGYSKGL